MSNVPANPNLLVVSAAASMFRAEDASDPRFYIFGSLLSGVLRFEVVARLANGKRGTIFGKEFFAAMMNHFNARIVMIESDWSVASGLTANIDRFNRACAAGITVENAAALTWTGLRASEHGFDVVTFI
jgi:hypothetical protein